MEKLLAGRGMGKTMALIRRAHGFNGYIVCKDNTESERIFSIAKELGLKVRFPITYYEFVNRNYHGMGVKAFHIDNVEHLLEFMSDAPISTITLTI